MADILIPGMKMPKGCGKCFVGDRTICADGCVLIELPEHGDLIDRDAIAFEDNIYGWRDKKIVKAAPVIVPSNKEDTE